MVLCVWREFSNDSAPQTSKNARWECMWLFNVKLSVRSIWESLINLVSGNSVTRIPRYQQHVAFLLLAVVRLIGSVAQPQEVAT
jgi:hypothetical protein